MTFFLAGMNLYLRPVPGGHIARSFQDAATARWGTIPATPVVTLIVLFLIATYVDRSRFGLRLRAVGWNQKSARLAGVSPGEIKVAAYIGSALLASAAGLFIASRTGSGDPLVGNRISSPASARPCSAGRLVWRAGTIWGGVRCALVLAMIGNVLNLLVSSPTGSGSCRASSSPRCRPLPVEFGQKRSIQLGKLKPEKQAGKHVKQLQRRPLAPERRSR
jgi:ribose/xylose/arabinose/galactoside ABC-type transport system permease subunit